MIDVILPGYLSLGRFFFVKSYFVLDNSQWFVLCLLCYWAKFDGVIVRGFFGGLPDEGLIVSYCNLVMPLQPTQFSIKICNDTYYWMIKAVSMQKLWNTRDQYCLHEVASKRYKQKSNLMNTPKYFWTRIVLLTLGNRLMIRSCSSTSRFQMWLEFESQLNILWTKLHTTSTMLVFRLSYVFFALL